MKAVEKKIGNTTACVAYYEDKYELTIMTEIDKDAYNSLVLYFLPEEFESLCGEWIDLIKETK